MQQRETLQTCVYRDVLMRIGESEFFDALPSLKVLCAQYRVSDNCIRAVIGRLKANGYISTSRGRPARIVSSPKLAEPEKQPYPVFFCERKELYSFYKAIHILFPSIYTYASLSCAESQREELSRMIPQFPSSKVLCSDYIDLNIRFFNTILSSVQNKLILYIVQTAMQNVVLPAVLLQNVSDQLEEEFLQSSIAMCRIYNAILEDDSVCIKKEWRQLLEIIESVVQKAISGSRDIFERQSEGFTGLQFTDEFKYLSIAYDLYEKILEGKYPLGTFLPTISQAQKVYHAAKTTIQTAYRVLADLEIVATTHGRGTEVIRLTVRNTYTMDEKIMNAHKHEYREAIEFLQIVCEDIILHVRSQSFRRLKDRLEGDLNPAHLFSALILCRYLMKETCDPALDTFFQVISRKLYWGVFFGGGSDGMPPEEKHGICMKIVDALEQQRTARAIDLTKELLRALYQSQ